MVRNEHIKECKNRIGGEGLSFVLNPRGRDHTSIYMFRYPCVANVINFTLGRPYDRKALMHWINGKMFGYSDEEIDGFIGDMPKLSKPNV